MKKEHKIAIWSIFGLVSVLVVAKIIKNKNSDLSEDEEIARIIKNIDNAPK